VRWCRSEHQRTERSVISAGGDAEVGNINDLQASQYENTKLTGVVGGPWWTLLSTLVIHVLSRRTHAVASTFSRSCLAVSHRQILPIPYRSAGNNGYTSAREYIRV